MIGMMDNDIGSGLKVYKLVGNLLRLKGIIKI